MLAHYARLLGLFIQTELQYEIAYRVNLLLEILQTLTVVATSLSAVLVLFNYTQTLNNWTLPQMLVLLGVYYLIQGVEETVFEPSVSRLMDHVRQGTLDFTLLKPANSLFMVSLRQWNVAQVAQIGLGVFVLGLGLTQLDVSVTAGTALAFAVTLACGFVLIYAILMILATTTFWFVRIDNIMAIFWAFIDAGRFPVDVYPGWLRVTLSTVVPIGVAVTFPAEAIAGRLDAGSVLATVVGTVAFGFFAAWFWRRGVRSYTGASA